MAVAFTSIRIDSLDATPIKSMERSDAKPCIENICVEASKMPEGSIISNELSGQHKLQQKMLV